jgi:trans-aconitate 2-methyltransferase
VTTCWDPQQYLRYGEERERPFAELLARVHHPDPRSIVDLGCGPGTTTVRLIERWPRARVIGVDSSAEMIAHAADVAIPGQLEFQQGDLRDWKPEQPVDVLLCAATFQWVEGHAGLFPELVGSLAPGGVFAFQVPGNFGQPSHVLLYELARSDRWADALGHLVRPDPVLEPSGYLSALMATGAESDVWETTYFHILRGPDAVLEWVRGTALRPFVSALESAEGEGVADEFLGAYAAVLRAAYPRDPDGRTIFPFRRIFAVATVPGDSSPSSGVE